MKSEKKFYTAGTWKEIVIETPEGELKAGRPVVVLCHGHSRHKDDGLDVLAKRLYESGFVTARFDFRGCGKDDHRYSLNCATEWPADLMNAISYLCALPFIDRDRIGVAGISMGAATAVYVAGMDPRIKSLVSMGGIADCFEWIKTKWKQLGGDFEAFLARTERDRELTALTGRSELINVLEMYLSDETEKKNVEMESYLEDMNAYVTLASVRDMMLYRPIANCSRITCPAFFAHGGDDQVVPFEQSQRMFDAVASDQKKIVRYPGIEHNIPQDPNRMVPFEDIAKWFEATLLG